MIFRLLAASAPRGAASASLFLCSSSISIQRQQQRTLSGLLAATITSSSRSSSSSSSSEENKPKKVARLDKLHIPVMQEEVINLWIPRKITDTDEDGDNNDPRLPIYLIDGTVGLGGHTLAAMKSIYASSSDVHVLGVDRDDSTLARAKKRAKFDDNVDESRVAFHHGSFSDISPDLLGQHSLFPSKVDGILIDLGMNSTQIDNAERGFTFRRSGPLDMRYDTSPDKSNKHVKSLKAKDIVNKWPASDMAAIFKNFADEPYAVEIAHSIVQWRKSLPDGKKIRSTLELRYIIEEAVEKITTAESSKRETTEDKLSKKNDKKKGSSTDFSKYKMIWTESPRGKKKVEKLRFKYEERKLRHPNHIMRCFQALRIEVNNELQHILSFFQHRIASQCLEVGGRLVMIAFHPGEDDLVQEAMHGMVSTGEWKLLTPEEGGLRPTLEEVKRNGRSRTARVRAVERIR